MKRTPLKRKTPLQAKKPWRSKPKKKTAKKKLARKKKPNAKAYKNKADKLLTPIIKAMHPYCLLNGAINCSQLTQVAHHHVLKSKCTALRYEIDNLIPLCNACHCLLHSHETYWSSEIVEIKGMDWWQSLKERKELIIKADTEFYRSNHERLLKLYEFVSSSSYIVD